VSGESSGRSETPGAVGKISVKCGGEGGATKEKLWDRGTRNIAIQGGRELGSEGHRNLRGKKRKEGGNVKKNLCRNSWSTDNTGIARPQEDTT